ncbi:MAG: helix-turn-helix domain-containing protein [Candidatus Bathyarchaeia archaeon]
MFEEELFQILTRLGLTTSQVKVYIELLELEKASGKTTAKYSKMARQEVYRVLAELQEKGLVEKIITRPTEYKPVSVEDCLSILIDSKKSEISENQKKASSLLQKLKKENTYEKVQPRDDEESQFILVPEKEAPKRVKRKIESTQTSLEAITPLSRFKTIFFNFYEINFDENLTRKLSSGVYFYSLQAGNYFAVRKMVLAK